MDSKEKYDYGYIFYLTKRKEKVVFNRFIIRYTLQSNLFFFTNDTKIIIKFNR